MSFHWMVFSLAVGALIFLTGCDREQQEPPPRINIFDAAFRGDLQQVRANLQHGTPVDDMDSSGATALHKAAHEGHLEVVNYLIRKGADVNVARPRDHVTPIMFAVRWGHGEVVKRLISKGANVNAVDTFSKTPVSWAKDAPLGPKQDQMLAMLRAAGARD